MLVTGMVVGGMELTSLDAVFDGTDARSMSGRRLLTFTDKLVFVSSLDEETRYMSPNNTSTPRSTTGAMTQGGIESVFGSLSTTAIGMWLRVADTGRPQLGHATAAVDISCPHSGQYMSDMMQFPPVFLPYRGLVHHVCHD
ncbi:MAG: hypothetical protein PSX80_17685 [bacterium]|nr:hypothetical protein [bacterium]